MDLNSVDCIQKLYDNEGLLDMLLNIEEYLDSNDLYVFSNWINGEVVEGPFVSKYWIEFTLKYNSDAAPDPRGTLMFKNQGTKISIKLDIEHIPIRIPLDFDDLEMESQMNGSPVAKPRMEAVSVILVKFRIPRKLLDSGSVEEYKIVDAEHMANALINQDDDEAGVPASDEFASDDQADADDEEMF